MGVMSNVLHCAKVGVMIKSIDKPSAFKNPPVLSDETGGRGENQLN
jgi:hypothetical protein